MSKQTITTIEIAGLIITRIDTPYADVGEIGIVIQDKERAMPQINIEREYNRRRGWFVQMWAGSTGLTVSNALTWGAIWAYACGVAADLETDVIPAPEF